MKKTIIFDLGNTLVRYFNKDETYYVATECLESSLRFLKTNFNINLEFNIVIMNFMKESYEVDTYQVRPLYERLIKSLKLDNICMSENQKNALCESFLIPIFQNSQIYNDTLHVVQGLKCNGYKLAIMSNMPWGSPSQPWKQEIEKFGILQYMDEAVFCSDIGWRKPSPKIFKYTLSKLNSYPDKCIFIGDDPIGDIQGAKNVGIRGILIDRSVKNNHSTIINNLSELPAILKKWDR